jgi:hypothetical protein
MTQNAQDIFKDIQWVVLGAGALILFAIAAAWPHRASTLPGSRGHRPIGEQGEHEVIRPDGYIDDFGNEVSEAGGGLPALMKIVLPGILIWWVIYLIVNWGAGPR